MPEPGQHQGSGRQGQPGCHRRRPHHAVGPAFAGGQADTERLGHPESRGVGIESRNFIAGPLAGPLAGWPGKSARGGRAHAS